MTPTLAFNEITGMNSWCETLGIDVPVLDAVLGHPDDAWSKAWARARTLSVVKAGPYELVLVNEDGYEVDEWEVQAARVAG